MRTPITETVDAGIEYIPESSIAAVRPVFGENTLINAPRSDKINARNARIFPSGLRANSTSGFNAATLRRAAKIFLTDLQSTARACPV